MKAILPWLLALFLTLNGCATVPVTGRRQLSLVSQQALASQGERSFREIVRTSELSPDKAKSAEVAEVTARIACAAEVFLKERGLESFLQGYEWESALVQDDSMINAFSLPSGKIVAYTGIFNAADTPDRLAAVIAHEAAHDIANHASERASQLVLLQFGQTTLSWALSQSPAQTQQILMTAYGAGSRYGVILPFNRQQELEADRIGLILMALAGYDPRQALGLWDRMGSLERQSPVEFLSTHPSVKHRVSDIRRYLPEALKYCRRGSPCKGAAGHGG